MPKKQIKTGATTVTPVLKEEILISQAVKIS